MKKFLEKVIKKDFTNDEVVRILTALGNQTHIVREDSMVFQTVCHNHHSEGSLKLYYYYNTQLFHCYTECADSFDIYDLVKRNKDCSFVDAIQFITDVLGGEIPLLTERQETETLQEWDMFKKYNNIQSSMPMEAIYYSPSILDYYSNSYPQEWLDEGISPEAMSKFGIRYDPVNNKAVIPQYDIENRLIGIRTRSFNPDEIRAGFKYMPLAIDNKAFYNHPTAYQLYGINNTQQGIKRLGKAMLFEGEKSVIKLQDYYGDNNFGVGLLGSSVSKYQRDLILSLGIKEVFLSFDKDYDELGSKKCQDQALRIIKIGRLFAPYVTTWVLWDTEGLLGTKDSPCDKGQEVLECLMKNKFEILAER